jgi:glutamate synthase (NADPH/NADH) large chain
LQRWVSRTLAEAIGHVEVLDTTKAEQHWKAHGLDLRPILHMPDLPEGAVLHNVTVQDHGIAEALDQELIKICRPALETGEAIRASIAIRNVDRTVGTILGHEVTKATLGEGLPDGTIDITFEGSAGQSFGAFLPAGVTLRLEGDSNDYLAKGLSGGRIVLRPARTAHFVAADNIIAGNVIAYGATAGELFIRGQVGERFCVRNSGAVAVVEGLGDHGCEYMTGGIAVVLGKTGRNVAAGMSGGIGYFLDLDPTLLNTEMVDALVPTDADLELLKKLIIAHREETGSDVAESLLADWHASARTLHQGAAARLCPCPCRPRTGRVRGPGRGDDHEQDDGSSPRVSALVVHRSGRAAKRPCWVLPLGALVASPRRLPPAGNHPPLAGSGLRQAHPRPRTRPDEPSFLSSF